MKRVIIFTIFFLIVVFILPVSDTSAGLQEEIDARNKQIEELQKQIDTYQGQIDENSQKARTLAGEIGSLNVQIKKVQLEIRSIGIAIEQTNIETVNTQEQIEITQSKLDTHKEALAKYIKILYQADQENLTQVLFKHATLSNFFDNLKNLQDTQNNLRTTIIGIKDLKTDLEQKKDNLLDKKAELEKLNGLQQSEKRNLDNAKKSKDLFLKETKGQETKFQQLVKQSKQDIERIKEQVFYLQQNGVSVEEAIKFGQLAAIRVGIRPAFLIAILEVESGLGRNVGTGNWLTDMYNCYIKLGKSSRAETEKAAFLEITSKLGLNPDAVKVSREPNYGCGGALGPAQFISTTWLAYEDRVAELTGHRPPNPWNIEDAFMASAIKLANGGATAQTRIAEKGAAKAYIGGSTKCSSRICNYYANAVLNKATVIEQNL
ncbi:MAG: lytic murein transglycosylase [Candidatus Yanofskybacteria bacterium]|nr:lytic murein transglycosylase [Candidatus Yanofskybacteria bacterium]